MAEGFASDSYEPALSREPLPLVCAVRWAPGGLTPPDFGRRRPRPKDALPVRGLPQLPASLVYRSFPPRAASYADSYFGVSGHRRHRTGFLLPQSSKFSRT